VRVCVQLCVCERVIVREYTHSEHHQQCLLGCAGRAAHCMCMLVKQSSTVSPCKVCPAKLRSTVSPTHTCSVQKILQSSADTVDGVLDGYTLALSFSLTHTTEHMHAHILPSQVCSTFCMCWATVEHNNTLFGNCACVYMSAMLCVHTYTCMFIYIYIYSYTCMYAHMYIYSTVAKEGVVAQQCLLGFAGRATHSYLPDHA